MRILFCCGLLLLAGHLAAEPARPTTEALGWLAGRWRMELKGRVTEEQWMAPAGGTMLGMSRTVKGAKTVEHEFIVLRTDEAGEILYVASPSGQKTTAFRLVRLEGQSVLFENKEHDFPQRVGYTLREDGTLLAFIEGERGGKTRRVEFPFRRVAG